MKELAKQYDPSQVEDRIYQFWLDGGYFHTKADPDKKPYTIVMPPPNVTGQLHMGHAVDNTMQDILIRTKRMQGYAALWVPGTDHASIATEAKVVEAMRAEGLTKEMVGRDGFLDRAWAWKTKYGNRIVSQLKKLCSSCDWERERFTMELDGAIVLNRIWDSSNRSFRYPIYIPYVDESLGTVVLQEGKTSGSGTGEALAGTGQNESRQKEAVEIPVIAYTQAVSYTHLCGKHHTAENSGGGACQGKEPGQPYGPL